MRDYCVSFRPDVLSCGLDDPQVLPPGPDRLAVLPAHHAGNLNKMIEVVRDPGGEKLPERNCAELGMQASPPQIGG